MSKSKKYILIGIFLLLLFPTIIFVIGPMLPGGNVRGDISFIQLMASLTAMGAVVLGGLSLLIGIIFLIKDKLRKQNS